MSLLWLLPLGAAVLGVALLGLLVRSARRESGALAATRDALEADRGRLEDLRRRVLARGRSGAAGGGR